MNYQDNKRVQTAEELRRMYNLDNLSKDRQAISNNKAGLTRIEAEQSNILKSLIINLGDSIEDQSEISLWFFNGTPTLDNIPTIEWEDKSEHVGDFYYDKDTGYAYKFILEEDTYLWEQQSDSNLIQALALTNAELDTVDGSRRVFFTTPTTPYDNGDWYVDENSDLYICQISKPSTEQYNPNDFIIASKYTDDTKAMEVAGKLTIVSGQVTTIIKNLDIISQTIEDNRYYIDETGNKILITEKMSQVVQTVNKLESEISEAADITISADGYGSVNLANINESEPIYLKIYPTNNNDISFLYPSDNLYPSDDLFSQGRIVRFATDEYYVDYELPDDLLYYDENNYDEFILDYNAQSCLVNKKVGYNADGSKYLLDSPQTLVYEYPTIHLNTGDYTVTMLGYEDAYIFVRMMVQSLYTDQFATKMELNSSITQTSKSINASIDEKLNLVNGDIEQLSADLDIQSDKIEAKLDSNDFTSAAVIGLINNRDGTSTAKINATNINLTGYITATNLKTSGSTIINGSNIVTGTIDANKVTVTNLNASNIKSGTMSADRISGGTIDASKITVTNLNASNITSGTIDASKVTVKNLNADNITSGTLSANKISGGTITASAINLGNGTFSVTTAGKVTATSGSIGGWNIGTSAIEYDATNYKVSIIPGTNANKDFLVVYNKLNNNYPFFVRADGYVSASNINITGGSVGGMSLSSGVLKSDRLSLNATSGILSVFNSNGGSMILSNACRLSATAGVGISANSTGSVSAPSSGIDIKGCSGSTVYIGCMSNSAGTTEKSCVSVENGLLSFRSSGYATYNGSTIWGSSSLATKENISDLTKEQKDEVYELIKNISLKKFDYKEQYSGQKNNYGFIIEDIENTYLKTLLHISQSSTNEDIKNYSTEDLARLELVVIQELMKKIERLEEQVNVD